LAGAFIFLVSVPLATFILGLFGLAALFSYHLREGHSLGELPFTVNQLTGLLFILGWLRWWWQGRTKFKVTPFFWLLSISFIYFSLSCLFSEDFRTSLDSLKALAIYFCISIVIASMLNTKRDVAVLAWLVLIITFLHSLLGFYEFVKGRGRPGQDARPLGGHVPDQRRFTECYCLRPFYGFCPAVRLLSLRRGTQFHVQVSRSRPHLVCAARAVLTLTRQVMIVLSLQLFDHSTAVQKPLFHNLFAGDHLCRTCQCAVCGLQRLKTLVHLARRKAQKGPFPDCQNGWHQGR